MSEELITQVPVNTNEKLLKKYDIPIHHLDFAYVRECNNGKELEQIIEILKSGEEGYYPELLTATIHRLHEINPSSKHLHVTVPVLNKQDVAQNEWNDISIDLQNWVDEANKNDNELLSVQNIALKSNSIPIRETTDSIKNDSSKRKTATTNRVKSTDYDMWDKYDVEAELMKIDLNEERLKQKHLKIEKEKNERNTVMVETELTTQAELKSAAVKAKNYGNEYFRAGDFDDALQSYTNSISFLPHLDAYNNRAITHIKLKNYNEAINDCNEVLKFDPHNEKAFLRKAEAYKLLKQYDKAVDCLEKLVTINPNNAEAQKTINSLKEKVENTSSSSLRSIRLKIEDIQDQELEIVPNVVVPIPSTSEYLGPSCQILTNVPNQIAKKLSNTKKTPAKSDENIINLNEQEMKSTKRVEEKVESSQLNDVDVDYARGDFLINSNQNISPFEFMKVWQSFKNDSFKLIKREKLLRLLNPVDLPRILGNKLDDEIFSGLIECLKYRFTHNISDVKFIHDVLEQLIRVPRIDIILLFISPPERNIVRDLLRLLNENEYALNDDASEKYKLIIN